MTNATKANRSCFPSQKILWVLRAAEGYFFHRKKSAGKKNVGLGERGKFSNGSQEAGGHWFLEFASNSQTIQTASSIPSKMVKYFPPANGCDVRRGGDGGRNTKTTGHVCTYREGLNCCFFCRSGENFDSSNRRKKRRSFGVLFRQTKKKNFFLAP